MRHISMLLCILCAFATIACDCDNDSATVNAQNTSIAITGNAALSLIDSSTDYSSADSGSSEELFDLSKPPLFYRLKLQILRKSIIANQCDSARIFISLRNGWGKIIEHAHKSVELEIVYGEALLSNTHPKLKNGRARVSITSGTPGKVVILAKYKLKNGKKITQSAVINVIDNDWNNGDNQTPVANAGEDQTVATGSTVTLDGSNSSDPDDDTLTYTWTISEAPQGSSATLSDATAINPSFTADVDGTYVIQLVVNDGATDSDPDSVTITTSGSGNSAPSADAGSDQQVTVGTTVMLDGSGSSDPDDDALTYAWTLEDTPQDSNAALSTPTTSETVFFTPDVEGTYTVRLIVNDGSVDSDPDEVTITTTASGLDGEELYVEYCQSCHGADGTTNGDLTEMAAEDLISLLPHYNVTSDDIGGTEGAQAISDYITN